MPYIIRTQYNRECILGPQVKAPDEAWQQLQSIPPTLSPVWHQAYPLSGGTCLAQEGTFTVLREVTPTDIKEATAGKQFNPARKLVLKACKSA